MQIKDVKDPFKEGVEVVKKVRHSEAEYSSTGTGAANAVYGWGTSADDYVRWQHPCHARMEGFKEAKDSAKFIFSRIIYPAAQWEAKTAATRYFEWILSPESPWRELFKYQPDLFENKELCLKNGFVFTKIDTIPSNLLMNFFVATRMPHEWPHDILAWDKLVTEYHCHPALAFMFLTLFYPCGFTDSGALFTSKTLGSEDVCQLSWTNRYDWPLDMVTCGEEYVQNFCAGKPEAFNQPFTAGKTYGPVNRIWGTNLISLDSKDTYRVQLHQRYKNIGTLADDAAYRRLDGTYTGDHKRWRLTYKQLAEVLHLEESRLVHSNETRKATA